MALRFFTTAGLVVSMGFGATIAFGEDYGAKVSGTFSQFSSMVAEGAGDYGMMTGTALVNGETRAATITTNGFRNLNPAGFQSSRIMNSWGYTYHVGFGEIGGATKALFWVGGEPAVLLHPSGAEGSKAFGVDGQWQSGQYNLPLQQERACVWNRSAASFRALGVSTFTETRAFAIDSTEVLNNKICVAGSGRSSGNLHALFWTHIDQGPSDIHPAGYTSSEALGCDYPQIVGYVSGPQTNLKPQAALWQAGSSTPTLLHPAQTFSESTALAVRLGIQVGYGRPLTQPNREQAILWHGNSNWTNLHARLPAPYLYWSSRATDIDILGNVVGFVTDGNGVSLPVIWERINSAVQIGNLTTLKNCFGVNTWAQDWNLPGPNLDARLSAVKPLSPKFARLSFRPGVLAHWNNTTSTLTYYDNKWNEAMGEVHRVLRAGLVPIIVLHTHHADMPDSTFGYQEPVWPYHAGWATEANTQAALASMAARIAKHISLKNPNSDFFIEVGNELNKNPEWPTKRGLYADLLFKVVDSVGEVAPRAIVMPSAFTFLESADQPNPPVEQLPVKCLEWLSGHARYGDLEAVGLHVYNALNDRPGENIGRAGPPEDLLPYIRTARTLAGNRLLVVSETGRSLFHDPEEPYNDTSAGNFVQRSQSNFVLRYLLTCLEGGADIIVVYELCDRTFGINDSENQFGLLKSNLQFKVVGSAVLELFNQVGTASPITWERETEVLHDQQPNEHRFLYEYRFVKPDGTSAYVRWTDRIHYGSWWPEDVNFPRRPTAYANGLLH